MLLKILFKFSSLKSNSLFHFILHLAMSNLHLYKKIYLCFMLSFNSLSKNKKIIIMITNFYYVFSVIYNIDSLHLAAYKDLLLF